jgi:hypothetical protein
MYAAPFERFEDLDACSRTVSALPIGIKRELLLPSSRETYE